MKSWVTAAALAGLAMSITGAAHAAPVYGDVNGDGKIDAQDVRLLMQVAGGLAPLNDTIRRNGDVAPVADLNAGLFGDGQITFLDAQRVWHKINDPTTPASDWPAKANAYPLEVGNSYTIRKYDATGTATTGPGTANPDVVQTIVRTQPETVGTQNYTAYIVTGTDGSEQHFVNTTDSQGRPAIAVTQGTFGGSTTTFNPPLIVLVNPAQPGVTWTATTAANTSSGAFNATYTGTISGPLSITTPAQTFDNALLVTIDYTAPFIVGSITGTEKYWFVPFLGPVQHGYTRTIPFSGTTTKDPDLKLVSANIHGVQYP